MLVSATQEPDVTSPSGAAQPADESGAVSCPGMSTLLLCTELADEATRNEKIVRRLTGKMARTAWPALPCHSLPMKLRS